VPQQSHFNPTLPTTIREFVTLGLVGIPVTKRDREERFSWSLQQVGLSGMSARDFWSLSVGQRQRALVARALVRRPSILIADEPTSGLDLSVESALYESLAELNRREGLSVVLVTHDLAVAARYGSHFALVHACCVQAGPAGQVLTVQNLEHAYGVPISVEHDATGSVAVRIGMPGGGA
jgi:ABC-type Mn2+/Zn2+ transport system ATPase subunit